MGISKDFIVKNGVQANGLIQTTANVQANQVISTAPQGTAPFTVQSNTLVANLNAAFIGGIPANTLPSFAGNNIWTGTDTFTNGVIVTVSGSGSTLAVNTVINSPSIVYNHTGNASFLVSFQGNGVARSFLESTNTGLVFVSANSTGGITGSVNAITIGLLNGNVTIGGTQSIISSNALFNGANSVVNGTFSTTGASIFGGISTFNANLSVNAATLLVGNSTVFTTVNGTSFSGQSNDTITFSGLTTAQFVRVDVNTVITATGLTINNTSNATSTIIFQGNGVTRAAEFTSNVNAWGIQYSNSTAGLTSVLTVDAITGNVVIGNTASQTVRFQSPSIFNQTAGFNSNITVAANIALNGNFVISIGNSTVNSSVNSTVYTGTSNNALFLGGNAAAAYAQLNVAQSWTAIQTFGSNVIFNTPVTHNDNTFFNANVSTFNSVANVEYDVIFQGNGVNRHTIYSTNSFLGIAYYTALGAFAGQAFRVDAVTGNVTISTQTIIAGGANTIVFSANSANSITLVNGASIGWGPGSPQVGVGGGGLSFNIIGNTSVSTATLFQIANGATNILAVGTAGITATVNSNFSNNVLNNAKLQAYKETLIISSATTTATTIDLSTANFFEVILQTATTTFTFSNPPASGNAYSFTIVLGQDATGGRTVTWPASVKFTNGTTPSLQAGVNKADIFTFFTLNGGTTYGATYAMANVAI